MEQLKKFKLKHQPKELNIVNLRVLGGNSKQNYVHKKGNEIIYDWLFILCDNGDRYLIPKEVIKDLKSCVTVGKSYQEYKV